jgi:hypothetical protein
LAAGIKDSSATAEKIKAFVSAELVNRIVCRIHVGCGGEKKSLEEIVVREDGGD